MTAPTGMASFGRQFDLTGRTALVVGGGSGISEAACLGLAAHGAACAVADVNGDASSYVTGTTLFADAGWTAIDGRFKPPV